MLAFILSGLLALNTYLPAAEGAAVHAKTVAPKEEGVKWLTIEQAQELNKKKPRKIFIDVYTDWCGWCKRMDKTTFNHPKVAKYLNDNFYPVKLDAEQNANIIFKDQVYKMGARGTHDLAVSLLAGQMSYPTTVYLDEKLNVISPIPGYMEAKQFNALLHFINTEAYKKGQFDAFEKGFKGDI